MLSVANVAGARKARGSEGISAHARARRAREGGGKVAVVYAVRTHAQTQSAVSHTLATRVYRVNRAIHLKVFTECIGI